MAEEKLICGLNYKLTEVPKGVRPRVIVDGVFHVGGTAKHPATNTLIPFKSLAAAERHIRNMGLEA